MKSSSSTNVPIDIWFYDTTIGGWCEKQGLVDGGSSESFLHPGIAQFLKVSIESAPCFKVYAWFSLCLEIYCIVYASKYILSTR